MKTLLAAAGVAALMLSGMSFAVVDTADARGAAMTDVTSNPAGKQPKGQQDKDPGGASMETETQNPSGKAPPGQQGR